MFVHPDHQRKKLGLTILLHLEDKARKDEFNHVICDPSITALDFYKKQGYYEVEKKKIEWIGEKILSVRLRKDLGLKKKNRFIC